MAINNSYSNPTTIELAQYEDFTRESERLYTIKDYIRNSVKPSLDVICAILEVEPCKKLTK